MPDPGAKHGTVRRFVPGGAGELWEITGTTATDYAPSVAIRCRLRNSTGTLVICEVRLGPELRIV